MPINNPLIKAEIMTTTESLPVHLLPGARATRLRGRPKKIRPAPDGDAQAYLADANARHHELLEADPLVHAADGDGAVLDRVIIELAREAACLKYERMQEQARGLETAPQTSSRVVDAYGKLAALLVQRHEGQRLDPSDRQLAIIKGMFVEAVIETANEVLTGEVATAFEHGVRSRLSPPIEAT